ncbi:MAG: DUF4440 domain-containing protein [Caldilineaceae bacterium]
MLRNPHFAILLVLLALVVSACQPISAQPAQAAPPAAEWLTESVVIDGVGPSTAVDPEQAAAEDEFRTVALAREQAYYDEDYEKYISFYADDVISLEPGTPEIVGKETVAANIKGFWEAYDTVGELTLKRIWVSGNYGTRYAEWEEVVTPADGGKPIHQIGRCFVVWEKIDGEWKIVSSLLHFIEEPTEME